MEASGSPLASSIARGPAWGGVCAAAVGSPWQVDTQERPRSLGAFAIPPAAAWPPGATARPRGLAACFSSGLPRARRVRPAARHVPDVAVSSCGVWRKKCCEFPAPFKIGQK